MNPSYLTCDKSNNLFDLFISFLTFYNANYTSGYEIILAKQHKIKVLICKTKVPT